MYIYKITNLINGKIYIGQTILSIQKRYSKHCNCDKQIIGKAIQKYGKENFKIEQIDSATSREELDEKECYWIRFYNSQIPNGYNLESGGVTNKEVNEVTRKKLRETHLGEKAFWYGKHLSDETKSKLSKSHIGKSKYWLGKKRDDETIKKMSKNRKGKTIGDTHVQSIKIICVETNIIYNSIGEASRMTGILRTSIINNLKNRSKSAGGYTWIYKK